jgi:DNA-binding response OmpR family regulator
MTALSNLSDVVAGFNQGADDYVTKPFAFEELSVRVAAVLRRRLGLREERIRVGDLEIDAGAGEVRRGERGIRLTGTELRLLLALARTPGLVVSKDRLAEILWAADAWRRINTVEAHISRLRRKLSAAEEEPLLLTVRGLGYKLKAGGKR